MPSTTQVPCPGCGQEARRRLRCSWSHNGYPARSSHGAQGGQRESREVLACGRLDWTEPGRDSREREGRGAADRRHRWGSGSGGRGRQGPGLSPVFAILDGGLAEAGPLQEWGIPASVCAGGEDAVLWRRGEELYHRQPKWSQNRLPPPLSTISSGRGVGVGGEKRCCFDSGGQGFLQ